MHHSTCITHVLWCMPESLTSGLLCSQWWGKCSLHSRLMHSPQFYVSGKRPMVTVCWLRWPCAKCWTPARMVRWRLSCAASNTTLGCWYSCIMASTALRQSSATNTTMDSIQGRLKKLDKVWMGCNKEIGLNHNHHQWWYNDMETVWGQRAVNWLSRSLVFL